MAAAVFENQVEKILRAGKSSCSSGVHSDGRRQRNSLCALACGVSHARLVVGVGVPPGASTSDPGEFGDGDRVMDSVAHYQTHYTSKRNLIIGRELSEFCVGIECLLKDETRNCVETQSKKDLAESGWKALIRLQTAARPE